MRGCAEVLQYTKHAHHLESVAACTDCHLPKLSPNKERYSIHDHKFDFSQPEFECTECHYEANDVDKNKDSDPLYIHAQKKFFNSEVRTKFSLCTFCHYAINDIHAAKHGGSGEPCSKCHFTENKETGELYYKHRIRKATVTKTKVFQDMCKLCHYTVPEYKHKAFYKKHEIEVKVDGTVESSCKRCHETFVER